MVDPPGDKRTRPAWRPAAFRNLTLDTLDASSASRIADSGDDGDAVVELAECRARRLLADLDLAPTVPVPCSGCCRCYGTPIGAECRS
jgi:hypothetical protein